MLAGVGTERDCLQMTTTPPQTKLWLIFFKFCTIVFDNARCVMTFNQGHLFRGHGQTKCLFNYSFCSTSSDM